MLDQTFTIKMPKDLRSGLDKIARADDRTGGAIIRRLLRDELQRRGVVLTEHGDDRMSVGGQGQGEKYGS